MLINSQKIHLKVTLTRAGICTVSLTYAFGSHVNASLAFAKVLMSLPKSWKSFVTGLTRRTSTSVSPDLATVLPLASHRRSVISPSSFAAGG